MSLSNDSRPPLSVVVTVVSGRASLASCLEVLVPQSDQCGGEVLVPYDKWSMDVEPLVQKFPSVRFHLIEDLGIAASPTVSAHQHRLYDRRRAIGLGLARGDIIAMTEDHAVPATDWCQTILDLHKESVSVLGGAIENRVDRPLHWAWYYCDFGRYGSPFERQNAEYVSDVNVSYKRDILHLVKGLWSEAYRETTVHWELRRRGHDLVRDPRLVVYQNRPPASLGDALKERGEWGRVFAESRTEQSTPARRLLWALGTPLLPFLLAFRVLRNMVRQGRTITQFVQVIPLAFLLLLSWSWGELMGYVFPPAVTEDKQSANGSVNRSAARNSDTGAKFIPILTYHSIDSSGSVVSVSSQLFEEHVECMAGLGIRCVSLQQAVQQRNESGVWPARTVVMTFDDAFLNVFESALPVLYQHGFTATVYVISDYVGASNEWENPPERLGRQATMEWDHLRTLTDKGWEIGAHTRTHPDLRTLTNEKLEDEVSGSRSLLEQHLGTSVVSFAYPYGLLDARSETLVKSGFETGCTTHLSCAGSESLHLLPRVDSYYLRSGDQMRRLLLGQLDGYLTMRRWARRIRAMAS